MLAAEYFVARPVLFVLDKIRQHIVIIKNIIDFRRYMPAVKTGSLTDRCPDFSQIFGLGCREI
jgi:hypothetical protein